MHTVSTPHATFAFGLVPFALAVCSVLHSQTRARA